MYEFINNLSKEDYISFFKDKENTHFMQSYIWGEVQKYKYFKPYYVGIRKNSDLVSVFLVLEKKILGKVGYLYIPRGPILDYCDHEIVDFFTKSIKKFMKEHNDFYTIIDPAIKLETLDNSGDVILGENNFEVVNYLKKCGYIHKGFNKNFENHQPRYTFRLMLNDNLDNIKKKFHSTTRNIINRGNPFELEISKNNINDLKDFYITMEETAKREHIIQAPYSYYENFYKVLHEQNKGDLYVIRVNINKLKEKYNILINELNQSKSITKIQGKLKDIDDRINKLTKEFKELNEIKDDYLVLSSMITAKDDNSVWTVHGGNHCKLRWLNANYLLYYEIIKDAYNDGFKMVDFFGTTGDSNPSNYVYGIHLFKKRLGGEYTEFIGEFNLVSNLFWYYLYIFYCKIRDINKKVRHKKNK